MSIYLTRHGQTDWNVAYLIQGRLDVPLNEEGKRQAEELALKLKDIPLDAIIVSPMKRAQDTAAIINRYHNLPIETDDRIVEQYYGQLEGKPRKGDVYLNHRQSLATRYPEGEGYFDVVYRVYGFLHELEEKRPNLNILVVAHGGMARVFNSYFYDMGNEEFVKFGLENCDYRVYEFPKRNIPISKIDLED